MIIILTLLVLIIVGIFMNKKFYYDNMIGISGFLISVASIVLLCIAVLIKTVVIIENSKCVNKYTVKKAYFESLKNNNQLTSSERERAVNTILEYNTTILNARLWRDNIYIGFFVPYNVGNLELIDINLIPKATKRMDIEIQNKSSH